jgi:hypothetical protein
LNDPFRPLVTQTTESLRVVKKALGKTASHMGMIPWFGWIEPG